MTRKDPEKNRKWYREYRRKWNREHPEEAKEHSRKTNHLHHYKNNRTPEQIRAHNQAEKIPLAEFCEICPEEDIRKATERHHPDYDFPEIFVSCCHSCHKYIDRSID